MSRPEKVGQYLAADLASHGGSQFLPRVRRLAWWVGLCWITAGAQADLQFDAFLGYGSQPTGMDGVVREAGWFSVGCEIFNDGPGFDAVVEVVNADGAAEQMRSLALELPTNTRKRFVIPVFSPSRGGNWEVRLRDARGKIRAEHTRLRPRSLVWEGFLMGAVPRSYAGAPRLPKLEGPGNVDELQPEVARIPVELVPDNPIAFEGLDALYLSSARALELSEPQVEALLSWLYGGGHLVLGVEQPADVNATPWLRVLVPAVLGESTPVRAGGELQRWLVSADPVTSRGTVRPTSPGRRSGNWQGVEKYTFPAGSGLGVARWPASNPYLRVPADPTIDTNDFLLISARLREAGKVRLEVKGRPWILSGKPGRGHLTVLLFSPEREPFRSWENREWFWARLMDLPWSWFEERQRYAYGGTSIDGVYGSMIDSRQVQKLPVKWLLLLLVVYLVVIGPLDQMILKKLNRQMLTWVTFPGYVVLFSLLIYYIGYRLRAGETEWNELHVVDVLPRVEGADLRGRTYASVYSPVNARYRMSSELPLSTLRGEFLGAMGGGRESARLELKQRDSGFDAQVFVPVWTSQLLVWEWSQMAAVPFEVSFASKGTQPEVTVSNRLAAPLANVRVVSGQLVYDLGECPASQSITVPLTPGAGQPLLDELESRASTFSESVKRRQVAFGSSAEAWVDLAPENLLAASLLGHAQRRISGNQRQFISPAGAEVTPLLGEDQALVLAWVEGFAPVSSLRQFDAVRNSRNTLLRLAVPLATAQEP